MLQTSERNEHCSEQNEHMREQIEHYLNRLKARMNMPFSRQKEPSLDKGEGDFGHLLGSYLGSNIRDWAQSPRPES